MTIRTFTPDDYEACAAIEKALYNDYATTAEESRFEDEHRDSKCQWARWVAEADGQVVGVTQYDQDPGHYHPRKFRGHLDVYPGWQGRGFGRALYEQLMSGLAPLEPISLQTALREDMAGGIGFLERRGFVEDRRTWPSELSPADFDFSPFAAAEARAHEVGVIIKTVEELESDAERNRKLHALRGLVRQDIPDTEPATEETFEFFVQSRLSGPYFLPDAYFVAVNEAGEYVGYSFLWRSEEDQGRLLYTGVTGVVRAYRRKGIALALKLRGITYAKEQGYPVLRTFNDSTNQAMLAVNNRLGFERRPAWIFFVKRFTEESA